jgi:uncharacterized Tic20 family protein
MNLSEMDIVLKEVSRYLPLLIPVIIIELGLLIFAIIQVVKNNVAYLPKWAWILIILFVNIIGPIVFLIIGRKKENDGRYDQS